MHEWKINTIQGDSANRATVVATCAKCGTIRSHTIVPGGGDDRINLGGMCPGVQGVDRSLRSG